MGPALWETDLWHLTSDQMGGKGDGESEPHTGPGPMWIWWGSCQGVPAGAVMPSSLGRVSWGMKYLPTRTLCAHVDRRLFWGVAHPPSDSSHHESLPPGPAAKTRVGLDQSFIYHFKRYIFCAYSVPDTGLDSGEQDT